MHSVYLASTFAGDFNIYLFEYIFTYWPMASILDVFIEASQTVLPNKILQKT